MLAREGRPRGAHTVRRATANTIKAAADIRGVGAPNPRTGSVNLQTWTTSPLAATKVGLLLHTAPSVCVCAPYSCSRHKGDHSTFGRASSIPSASAWPTNLGPASKRFRSTCCSLGLDMTCVSRRIHAGGAVGLGQDGSDALNPNRKNSRRSNVLNACDRDPGGEA